MIKPQDREIEQWDMADIRPYDNNPKKHPPEQIDMIAASIKEFEWLQPIVVDAEGVIIVGHGRFLAAKQLGYEKIPVVVRDDMSPDSVDRARLIDNEVVGKDIDSEKLMFELGRLIGDGDGILNEVFDETTISMAENKDILGETNDDAIVDDINQAVEDQSNGNDSRESAQSPLTKAFGFAKVEPSTSRLIRRFMAQIEEDTDLRGEQALVSWLNDLLTEKSVSDE